MIVGGLSSGSFNYHRLSSTVTIIDCHAPFDRGIMTEHSVLFLYGKTKSLSSFFCMMIYRTAGKELTQSVALLFVHIMMNAFKCFFDGLLDAGLLNGMLWMKVSFKKTSLNFTCHKERFSDLYYCYEFN